MVLVGCGRLGFDDVPDATVVVGHDEDGDGIGDGDDPCPHVAGDRADRDDDGVGDACDPRPDTAGDTLALFNPFTPDAPDPFEDRGPLIQRADAVEVPAGFGFHIVHAVTNANIEIGFEILERVGSGQHQLALGAVMEPYYFGELNDNLEFAQANVNIVYANRTTNSYDSIDAQDLATIVHPGEGVFRLGVHAGATPTYALDAGWPGEMYRAAGPTPGYVGADKLDFVVTGLHVQLRYLVIVEEPR